MTLAARRPPTPNAAPRPAADHDPVITLGGATWADYQRLLEIRGDRPTPRIAYLSGVLQLTTPSRRHEATRSMIGRLVEAWCVERDIGITPYGSWTLENKTADRGAEPDECYVLGDDPEPERPDLVIEVVVTSGGVDKLEIYRKLHVREVWFWADDRFSLHALRGEHYEPIAASEVLVGIDLDLLARFIDVVPMTEAVRAYRAALST